MDDIEYDNNSSGLEVEITDLYPVDEGGRFAALRLTAHHLLSGILWQQLRSSSLKIVLLCAILLVPLAMNTSYRAAAQNTFAQECVRQQSKIITFSNKTITPSHVTITVITFTEQLSDNAQNSSITYGTSQVSSSTCQ